MKTLKFAGAICLAAIVGLFYIPVAVWLFSTFPNQGALWALLVLGSPLAFVVWTIRRWLRQLNAAFVPLGLKGSLYFVGRRYRGVRAEREVEVCFEKNLLSVYLTTPLQTRLWLRPNTRVARGVASIFGRSPQPISGLGLDHLTLEAMDDQWARTLVADPIARGAIQRLSREEGVFEVPVIRLLPGAVVLQLVRPKCTTVTPERARQWLDDLLTLAQVAESLALPQQTAEPSWFDRKWRTDFHQFFSVSLMVTPLLVAFACFGVLALIALLALGTMTIHFGPGP